ncbi:MAG: MBL fold metallo-hydrolase [Puniceicoccales bacterium]|jgi:Cft2 family RNA processing exonuclease|nr:MBL fold metallo-hydrolase [Puniceicoccales bacterium]
MKLTDLNSAQDIGANCLLVEIGSFHILIDAGMHPKRFGLEALPHLDGLPPLDKVILTHCHLDHLGALPVVLRKQPNVEVLCSPASALIARRILRNSVSVMMRQREETGVSEYPLFTYSELDRVQGVLREMPLLKPRVFRATDGSEISITLHPAGHVAGAVGCLIEHKHRRIFFTGDVLFHDQETVPAAQFPEGPVDTLIVETTHGATPPLDGVTRAGEAARMVATVNETVARGGSVLIPAFAFGRMQEMLVMLNNARRNGTLTPCPIYCSGLGLDLADYFDMMSRKKGFVNFRRSVLQELKVMPLNQRFVPPGQDLSEKGIYLLSSGMLVENTPAWRVAANLLDHAHNTLCFVGYCDPDTPGGRLLSRKRGESFAFKGLDYVARIKAHIEKFHFSGHASRDELIDFARRCDPRAIVLTHGDPPAREWVEEELAMELPSAKVTNPVPGKTYLI